MTILCFRLVATFYWHLHPLLRWRFCTLGSLLHSTCIYTHCWDDDSEKLMCSVAHSLLWYATGLWIKSQSFHINCHWEMGISKGDVQMVSPDQIYGVFCNYLTTLKNNATCPPTWFAFQSFSRGYYLLVMCFQWMVAGLRFSAGSASRTEPNRFTWT
jgi:hypothetical protein